MGHKHKKKVLDCCQCVDSICTRGLREQLKCHLNKVIQVFTRSSLVTGTVLKVDCGGLTLRNFFTDQLVFVPLCDSQLIVLNPFNEPASPRGCEIKKPTEPLNCDCKCEEDVCTRDLRRHLKKCINQVLTIFTKGPIIDGTLKRVSGGVAVLTSENRVYLVPICQITAVVRGDLQEPESSITPCFTLNKSHGLESCDCPCVESSCVRTTREILCGCINEQVNILTSQLVSFSGTVADVSCGTLLLKNAELDNSPATIEGGVLLSLCLIEIVTPGGPPFANTVNNFNDDVIPLLGTGVKVPKYINQIDNNRLLRKGTEGMS